MRTLGKKIAPRVLYALTAAAGALSLLGIVLLAVAGGTITQLQGATAPLWLLEGLYALGLALLCCTAVLAGLRRSAVRPCPPGLRAVLWCAVAGAVVLLVNAPLAHLGRQLLRGDYLSVLATEMDPVSLGAGIALLRLYLIAQAVVGVWALGKLLGRALCRLFGVRPQTVADAVTEEDIRLLVDEGGETGAIEQSQKDMIAGIFELDDITAEDIMTHRTEITAVELSGSIQDVVGATLENGFSRIPI